MHPALVALAICFVSISAEIAAAGSNPRAYLHSIQQPAWALRFWSWYVIGVFFYGACFIALYLVLLHDPSLGTRWRALEYLIAIMILNPIWNAIFFRAQSFSASFWLFLPFTLLVFLTVYELYWVDGEAAAPFIPYLLYLPYGGAWTYAVWRMNRRTAGAS